MIFDINTSKRFKNIKKLILNIKFNFLRNNILNTPKQSLNNFSFLVSTIYFTFFLKKISYTIILNLHYKTSIFIACSQQIERCGR